jgi:transposase
VCYTDQDFASLYPVQGQPAQTPWRLALVLVFQFMEGLSDRQAADAVRSRIDWKYALSLELNDAGFDASVLSEFRSRLIAGGQEMLILDTMLQHFQQLGLLKERGRQRTDSTHVLAAVRALNRYECIGETLRHTLNVLATVAPTWLRRHLQPEWIERYAKRFDDYLLPKSMQARMALVEQIGADGRTLLNALYAEDTPAWLRQVPAVKTLRIVWLQQFYAATLDTALCWRELSDQPPASQLLHSPYDVDARYGGKRMTNWVGYKVHLTESCEDDQPHLITHVLTTEATTQDYEVAAPIQADLAQKALLPSEHLLDAGYVDAELLVQSQEEYQVTVTGPVLEDHSWQAKEQSGYDLAAFMLDWEAKQATCPHGNLSRKWSQTQERDGTAIINIRFDPKQCALCPARQQCTRSQTGPRNIKVRPRPIYEALQAARVHQQSAEFRNRYRTRAGIEGTLSQALRRSGMRQARYIGFAKTRLQHILTAAALNLYRITDWLAEQRPAQTRSSPLVRLATLLA